MGKKTATAKPTTMSFPWDKLAWDDLSEWTDSRSLERGRSYQRRGAVQNLAMFPDGGLIADVTGTHRYATHVSLKGRSRDLSKRLKSECSCPVEHRCKHAVAVILEHLSAVERGTSIPRVDNDDARLALIEKGWARDEEFFDDDGIDDFEDRIPPEKQKGRSPTTRSRKRTTSLRKVTDADVAEHLFAKSKDELAAIILQMCRSDQKFKQSFVDRIMLETGNHAAIIREARKELRSVTAEEAWYNPWEGYGNLPDYSRLESRLQALIDAEQFDAVVELGRELIECGMRQVEESHDDGETASQIMSVLSVVAKAIMPSSMSDSEKILFVIESFLQDDYDLCDDFGQVLDQSYPKTTWAEVAETLKSRLPRDITGKRNRATHEFSRSFARERLSGWIIEALEAAGENEAATEFCIEEATKAGSYQRAVDRLMALKRYDQARELASEGLANTDPTYGGLINQLQDSLAKIAAKSKDHCVTAAVAADRFVAHPSVSSLNELLKAAKKAKCESTVKEVAMRFLETGVQPTFAPAKTKMKSRTKKPKAVASNKCQWPFATPPRGTPSPSQFDRVHSSKPSPHYGVLIRLSIQQRDPESTLRWYDVLRSSKSNRYRFERFEIEVADSVSSHFPNRAIELYCGEADRLAAETNTKLYPQAVSLLKKVRKILKAEKRSHEFEAILNAFLQRHRRKRRLVELLRSLRGEPILSMNRASQT